VRTYILAPYPARARYNCQQNTSHIIRIVHIPTPPSTSPDEDGNISRSNHMLRNTKTSNASAKYGKHRGRGLRHILRLSSICFYSSVSIARVHSNFAKNIDGMSRRLMSEDSRREEEEGKSSCRRSRRATEVGKASPFISSSLLICARRSVSRGRVFLIHVVHVLKQVYLIG